MSGRKNKKADKELALKQRYWETAKNHKATDDMEFDELFDPEAVSLGVKRRGPGAGAFVRGWVWLYADDLRHYERMKRLLCR